MKCFTLIIGLIFPVLLLAEERKFPEIPVLIDIYSEKGEYHLDFNKCRGEFNFTNAEVEENLKSAVKKYPNLLVHINGSKDIPLSEITSVYFRIKSFGIKNIRWVFPDPNNKERTIEAELEISQIIPYPH